MSHLKLTLFKKMNDAIKPRWNDIYKHPLNEGLGSGTLSKEIFCKFLAQDQLYLLDFSTALKLTGRRFTNTQHENLFIKLSNEAYDTQRKLHQKYLLTPQMTSKFFRPVPLYSTKNTVISDYTNHLLTTANYASVEEAVASLIPCFYIYS